ncbi:MAG: PHP domain-containing protein [Halobacteria archaeon]
MDSETDREELKSGVADLHMHTVASDGTDTISTRLEQAADRGLDVIAVTDHDILSNELDDRSKMVDGVELITGVEARADVEGTKVEFLGLYVDPDGSELSSVLEKARRYRHERNRQLVENFNDVTGMEVELEELQADVEGVLGRPHFAEILMEEGYVDDVGEAFDEYLGEDGEIYVRMEYVPYREVIDAIHAAGGVASLAHPGRISTDDVPGIVEELAEYGLDGVEVWYPYGDVTSDRYADLGVEDAHRLAEKHGLIKTGGSDCHGRGSGKYRIGEVRVPEEELEKIREKASPG